MKSVVLQSTVDSDQIIRRFWQRSYPDEYSELLVIAKQSREGNPFQATIETIDSELTPGSFGVLGWDRAIIPRVFDQLGHPLNDDAHAQFNPISGKLELTHFTSAINSFRERFPEFKTNNSEQ